MAKRSEFAGKKVKVNGVELTYNDAGDGDPVVCVHGGVSDMRTWRAQVPDLVKTHRVITYSRRYARPNAEIAPGAPDPMDVHVADMAALIETLQIAPTHLVGHSWGAFICLNVAIRQPHLVRSLCLLEPPVLPLFVDTPPKPSQLIGLLMRRPAAALAVVKFGAGSFEPSRKAFAAGNDALGIERFGRGVLGNRYFEALSEERYAQVWENRGPDKAQILGDGFPPLRDAEVRGVKVPVLLMTGADSPPFLAHLTHRLGELLPNSSFVSVPHASHIMHEDNPKAVNAAMEKFWADQSLS